MSCCESIKAVPKLESRLLMLWGQFVWCIGNRSRDETFNTVAFAIFLEELKDKIDEEDIHASITDIDIGTDSAGEEIID